VWWSVRRADFKRRAPAGEAEDFVGAFRKR
jgi:hypothetical protein